MKAPKDQWTIQIDVTNACVRGCANCTRFCGLHKKPFFMDYDYFCKAVDTLVDHPGLIGIMGGEPTLHPKFKEMCEYLHSKVDPDVRVKEGSKKYPTDSFIEMQRRFELDEYEIHEYADGPRPIIRGAGLWTSMTKLYLKNLEVIQDTFNFQNLNDHNNVSFHQPVLITRNDMGIDDNTWEKLKNHCWINQEWSGSVTPKGCFFCEVAGALDILYDGPGGLPLEEGWWKKDISAYKDQFHWCELCGVPLKTFARDAREEVSDISKANYELLKTKDTVKFDEGKLNVVKIKDGQISPESMKETAKYHGVSYMEDAQGRMSDKTPIYAGSFIGIVVCKAGEGVDEEVIKHNLKYLQKIYIVEDGVLKKRISSGKADNSDIIENYDEKLSISSLKDRFGNNAYIFIITPEIKVGEGVEKLRNSVINPGTLHYTDIKKDRSESNPYIDNSVTNGRCVLISSLASSLGKLDSELPLDEDVFKALVKEWNHDKRVRLTSAMDRCMYGVSDRGNDKETMKRRMADAKNLLRRWNKKYGAGRTVVYGAKLVKRYGVKLMRQKMKNRLF